MSSNPNIIETNISATDSVDKQSIRSWFDALAAVLSRSHQRAILVLRGPRQWGLETLDQVGITEQSILLSNDVDDSTAVAFSKAENLLGMDADHVIYDLNSGLNTDVLCMASGLVRASGMLIILCPLEVTGIEDRYGVWQGKKSTEPLFLNRLLQGLEACSVSYSIEQNTDLPGVEELPVSTPATMVAGMTEDQQQLSCDLKAWSDSDMPLYLLTAERGRGKSTCLGRYVNQLSSNQQVVICAASRAQAGILLQQLDDDSTSVFLSPDEIIRRQETIGLLVIDEAAMIPNSMLKQCVELSRKVIMATTTGGYEGTGQGFLLKFIASFDRSFYQSGQLNEAVRWGQNDLLEHTVNQLFMLDSGTPLPYLEPGTIKLQVYRKKQLQQDPQLLKSVYQLLVSAHYRTRPSDLRQLMEDENQLLITASDQQSVLGVLLLNQEGGFDADLSEQIFIGKRRPQGHLLAQMLTAQAGLKHFSCYRGYRIQRIAVEQHYRRQGIGRMLVEKAEQLVSDNKLDYLGSSFALDKSNTAFWKACGFKLLHIASGTGKSSGRQTLAVLKSENVEVVQAMQTLQHKMQQDLPVYLLTYCRDMYWQDVLALLDLLQIDWQLTQQDKDELYAFASGFRGLDYTQAALQRFLIQYLTSVGVLDQSIQRLLIEKILLDKNWQQVLKYSPVDGRKSALRIIRENIREIYEHTSES